MKNTTEILSKLHTINNLRTIWNTWEQERLMRRECGEEKEANYAWIMKSIIETHMKFRKVFELLKKEKYYEAWCEAEQIEILSHNIKNNDDIKFDYIKPIVNQIRLLQSLYPYRLFLSSVIDIKEEVCSVCGAIRSFDTWCGHETGKVYNGELCYNMVTKCEFKSIDIVLNPVNKYSVVFIPDKTGKRNDQYDYSLVKGLMQYWKNPYQKWKYEIEKDKKKVIFLMQPL